MNTVSEVHVPVVVHETVTYREVHVTVCATCFERSTLPTGFGCYGMIYVCYCSWCIMLQANQDRTVSSRLKYCSSDHH